MTTVSRNSPEWTASDENFNKLEMVETLSKHNPEVRRQSFALNMLAIAEQELRKSHHPTAADEINRTWFDMLERAVRR